MLKYLLWGVEDNGIALNWYVSIAPIALRLNTGLGACGICYSIPELAYRQDPSGVRV